MFKIKVDKYINFKNKLTFDELEYDLITSFEDLPFVNDWTTQHIRELLIQYHIFRRTFTDNDFYIVKHGHWIDSYPEIESNPMFMYGICSVCGFKQSISDKLKFCPECGSVMDELKEKLDG